MVSRSALRFFLAPFSVFFLCSAALAQKALRNDDVSVDGFYQFTQTASGNGISDTATKSLGGEASFRHSFHWYMGYEAAYDYTRFTEYYTGQAFGYQHNLHVFSGSYYVHGPSALGLQPFALAGISAAVFSPVAERRPECPLSDSSRRELRSRHQLSPARQRHRPAASSIAASTTRRPTSACRSSPPTPIA